MSDRRTLASAPAIAGAGALFACLLLAAGGPAARAAGGDLTPQVLKARAAVGAPVVGATPAVRAAVGAVLAGGDAQGAFASAGGKGQLVTATAPPGGARSPP